MNDINVERVIPAYSLQVLSRQIRSIHSIQPMILRELNHDEDHVHI